MSKYLIPLKHFLTFGVLPTAPGFVCSKLGLNEVICVNRVIIKCNSLRKEYGFEAKDSSRQLQAFVCPSRRSSQSGVRVRLGHVLATDMRLKPITSDH
ncbi:unnamed protein product [Pieris macdunnoughi]|uniref:Uncharacterized protein n=1 Tax=Pieris macdunnoughi TaxID=345717 RepID=A0A821V0U4_9NEOP|nr:unnamed protein product [Pieris macdunnoughi]